jgi:SNF2 family DNA or RNA helicase
LRPYQKEGVKWVKYLYDNNMAGFKKRKRE